MGAFPAHLERLGVVDSTQRVVAGWLAAGVPDVAVAVADVQTAGRGRLGRSWSAPRGAALLLSCGFRPAWLHPRHAWRLGAIVALAMADAGEEAAGLPDGALGLKWPNDLVADPPARGVSDGDRTGDGDGTGDSIGAASRDTGVRKVAGVLGETASDGDRVATAVVGIGVNVTWRREAFPPDLRDTMTSLSVLAGGRPVDRDALLDAFLARLAVRYEALAGGRFDAAGWSDRQRTTGRDLEIVLGRERLTGLGAGVDPERGALLVDTPGGTRAIDAGDVTRCRLHV